MQRPGDETPGVRTETSRVLSSLAELGVLLKQDKRLPNVVTLVTGERLSTSWWSHPKGRLIFRVLDELSDHPDVLFCKLLLGKDTLVHRSLWPALLSVVAAGEPWQKRGLSPSARTLLDRVNGDHAPVLARGAAVKQLMSRLLVHGVAVHTDSGQHEIAAESWRTWAKGARVTAHRSTRRSREVLERACQAIGAEQSALPWISAETPANRSSKPARTARR